LKHWWEELPRSEWDHFEGVKQSQRWFEVYKIFPGTFAIWEPNHQEKVISYLILGSKRSLLFDTGLGIGNMKRVVSELSSAEVIVLNSHTHWDHIGGNYQFENIYGVGLEFATINSHGKPPEASKKYLADNKLRNQPADFLVGDYEIRAFNIIHMIEDRETIDLGDRLLEVILTPGHTPDGLCLLERDSRILFTGDTFYLSSLHAHRPESDFDAYLESAYRLNSMVDSIDKLLPAHKVTWVDSVYLKKMYEAFKAIKEGTATFAISDDAREYKFHNFSILL
jgi:glyoxylase-like metal-dependent hydrolase (beta-lactamase superfamily II)